MSAKSLVAPCARVDRRSPHTGTPTIGRLNGHKWRPRPGDGFYGVKQKPRLSGAFLEADDGTRTHDLLQRLGHYRATRRGSKAAALPTPRGSSALSLRARAGYGRPTLRRRRLTWASVSE
jgi:hypothetical protein